MSITSSRFILERNVVDEMFGGSVRIAVDVERHNKRLVKYTTFLENPTLGSS